MKQAIRRFTHFFPRGLLMNMQCMNSSHQIYSEEKRFEKKAAENFSIFMLQVRKLVAKRSHFFAKSIFSSLSFMSLMMVIEQRRV